MGFLHAIRALGVMAQKRSEGSALADIMSFLQLPHPLEETDDKRARVIRVWLNVTNPEGETLDVQGVSKIDLREYPIFDSEDLIKERYLYRKPVGSAAQWGFSPIYKLGKRDKDGVQSLIGADWRTDKDSRYYKLKRTVLSDFEASGCFSEGSVDRIMTVLVTKTDEIAGLWTDKKRSYLLLFGVDKGGEFLYPGQVPAFVKYFRDKLAPSEDKPLNEIKKNKNKKFRLCAACGEKTSQVETLDKVFKFATFDKESFLPGAKGGSVVREKVFPICPECYALLSAGKTEMENKFVNLRTLPGINLYVVPEICSENQEHLKKLTDETRDFLENGIKTEKRLFDQLARRGEGLVYHFLFTELNNAQVKVHFLIEDVPPSRLNRLQCLWSDGTCKVFLSGEQNDDQWKGLDHAFRQIVAVLLSLAGKREGDKKAMRDKALQVIGGLLNNEKIEVSNIKNLMVSRFSGLFTDPEWMKPKNKEEMSGRMKLKGMAEVIDFLIRANGRRER